MHKKLTITVDQQVYEGLYRVIGAGRISAFLESLARPYVLKKELENAYAEMANDEKREEEAKEWSENLITDIQNEKR